MVLMATGWLTGKANPARVGTGGGCGDLGGFSPWWLYADRGGGRVVSWWFVALS